MADRNDRLEPAPVAKVEAAAAAAADKPEDLYVITENGEQCFLWRSNQLTYIAQDRHEIPAILATKFGHLATRLDLSYNSLTSFKNINSFTNLNELILDNNLLEDDQLEFAQNLRLKTLSLNKNRLANLYKLVNTIKVCLPNLEYLSLIGNPLCPGPVLTVPPDGRLAPKAPKGPLNIDELVLEPTVAAPGRSSSEFSQRKYRHFIIYHLPNLRFLDSSPITSGERDEALRRCFWMSQATLSQLNPDESTTKRLGGWRSREPPAPGRQRHHSELSVSSADDGDNELPDGQADGQFRLTAMAGTSKPRGVFSRLAYKYTGKNSEGNRFIRNQDL